MIEAILAATVLAEAAALAYIAIRASSPPSWRGHGSHVEPPVQVPDQPPSIENDYTALVVYGPEEEVRG